MYCSFSLLQILVLVRLDLPVISWLSPAEAHQAQIGTEQAVVVTGQALDNDQQHTRAGRQMTGARCLQQSNARSMAAQ